MSLDGFIGTVWGARLLENLQKALVFGQVGVINRDYEGDLKGKGSTVKITSIGDITIGDYVADTDISDPEALTDAATTLTADNAKYFNFAIDDVVKAQSAVVLMDGAMKQAAYNLADTADQIIAAAMVAGASASNAVGSNASAIVPVPAVLGTTAYDYLLDLRTKLTESNVPYEGRWAIVPPWFSDQLAADSRFASFNGPAAGDALLNGIVKRAAGFNIFESNNTPTAAGTGGDAGKTQDKIIAGHPMAVTFADSVNEVVAYKPEKRFADAVKGLHVYGVKVTRSSALAVLTARVV
jgi:N4-gp56 family major capsid protein